MLLARMAITAPPEMFRSFDDLLRGAFLAGAVDAVNRT